MNLDRFTVKSQEALERAQRIARENGNPDLGNFHLLAALLTEDESPVAAVLEKLGARREAIANEVAEALGRLPRVQGGSMRAGPADPSTTSATSSSSTRTPRSDTPCARTISTPAWPTSLR